MNKPKIFLNVSTFLPGYRGGGPVKSVKSLVNALSDQFSFYIFTVNHDFGLDRPYENICTDQWNDCYGAKVFYSSEKKKNKNLQRLLKEEVFDLFFLNSFFSTDTLKIILLYRLYNLKTPIVLMPRGELSEGALNIKKVKKKIYIQIIKLMRLFKNIHFLSTAKDEFEQIKKYFNSNSTYSVSNIPNSEKKLILNTKENEKLRVVFLSRITEKKNLDYALRTLKNCKNKITLDIYGTIENEKYWAKCQLLIRNLPANVNVLYKGEINNDIVIEKLSNYDVFYFPTKSENYGHVISEALQASIPVLLSNTTPWLDLEETNFGWVYDLSNSVSFTKKLDELAKLEVNAYNDIKTNIYESFDVQSTYDRTSFEYRNILKTLTE